ncbi:metal-dependent hydrolase [Halobacillus litoralis]|uniref:zinc dependent phospholipase C family protein n=1 Tax=Halobacillus litoralis TaxID=45668 RepID=UPI001CD64809|nr:zinc dependent phospholipase C family protein [Halobacillus litoralis]MCA0971616.1 metal-dependent hydrolase [Halobacillus litoralis]
MNTLHHGYWTFFAARKKNFLGWFIFGSVLPDLIYYVMFIYLAIERNALQVLGDPDPLRSLFFLSHDLFDYQVVIILRQVGHSLFVWGVFMALVLLLKGRALSKWTALAYGWLGHVVIDILTHAEDAVPLFYPISAFTFHSPISYWDDDHYAGLFNLVNRTLILLSLLYLFSKWCYKRWKQRGSFTKSS